MEELWRLEKQFWTGDAGFYGQHLAGEVLMVFPQPLGVLDRQATVESIESADRWRNVAFANEQCVTPAEGTAILAYTVEADRGRPGTEYAAQCSSTYVSTSAGWQLALHHQTPLG